MRAETNHDVNDSPRCAIGGWEPSANGNDIARCLMMHDSFVNGSVQSLRRRKNKQEKITRRGESVRDETLLCGFGGEAVEG